MTLCPNLNYISMSTIIDDILDTPEAAHQNVTSILD